MRFLLVLVAACSSAPAVMPDAMLAPPTLFGVWGSDANHAWAVGARGTILAWNGATWSPQSSGTTEDLHGVWGTDASHVWAAGAGGTIVFWNGSAWTAQPSGTSEVLYGIWGASATDLWIVGSGMIALHGDGTQWTTETTGLPASETSELSAIWGSSSTDIWATAYGVGKLYFWKGTSWSEDTLVAGFYAMLGVWGSGPDDVWMAGLNSMYWHFTPGKTYPDYTQVANALHPNFNGVWGSSATDPVWAVADDGVIAELRHATIVVPMGPADLEAVWGDARDHVWAVGSSETILLWNGTAWSKVQ